MTFSVSVPPCPGLYLADPKLQNVTPLSPPSNFEKEELFSLSARKKSKFFFLTWGAEIPGATRAEQTSLIRTDRRSDWSSPWINSVLVFWQDLCASSWENTPAVPNKIRYPFQPCGEDQSTMPKHS